MKQEELTIIFDLDGTLLNTIEDLGHACNHALKQSGFPTHPIEAYPALVGDGISNLIRRALPIEDQNDENVLRVREQFVPYYNEHLYDYTRPYEGIDSLLRGLKYEGHFLAVASNKYQAATEMLINIFFPGMFDVILGEREGFARKPSPEIVFEIRRRLPGYALYVGDSLVDWQTAYSAQVPFVGCSWGFVPREKLMAAGVQDIADRPFDVLRYV